MRLVDRLVCAAPAPSAWSASRVRLDSSRLVAFPLPTGLRARIEDVVVDQAARGRGVGTPPTMAALDLARQQGARSVDLTSGASRVAAALGAAGRPGRPPGQRRLPRHLLAFIGVSAVLAAVAFAVAFLLDGRGSVLMSNGQTPRGAGAVPRRPLDREACERRAREGPCFVCETLAGNPEYRGHVVWADDDAAVLARDPPLPPGVPDGWQQLVALSWKRGVVALPDHDMADLARRLRARVERVQQGLCDSTEGRHRPAAAS